MVLAMGLFSIMDALVKWLGSSYPTVQLVFFRSLFAFVPIAFLIFHGGLGNALRMTDRRGHLIRAAVGILALGAFFYAFANMRLADAVAIGFAAPIFVTALSVPLLGERVGPRRWCAVLLGFAGVMVMLRPGAAVFDPVAVVPLVGVVFYALAAIMVRRLSKTETSAAIVFYFTLSCTLISGLLLPFFWVTPDAADFALLACVGLIGGLAQITITNAFRLADVAVIMPFEYSAMIWAALLGFFIWGEMPGNHIWLGVAIVTASGLYILYRETSLGLRRGTARRLQTKR
jgi:drug/metabolite transporter (DMT)-like permease